MTLVIYKTLIVCVQYPQKGPLRMNKVNHETSIKSRLTLSCQNMGITIVDLCAAVRANTSGLYKALNNHSQTYSHYGKMCTHLKVSPNWLIFGERDQEPAWINAINESAPTPSRAPQATRPAHSPRHESRRRRTTLGDDEVAERLEILERRYAVVADRFLSLAERAENEGVFVSPREIDEIKNDLENLTGK